MKPNNVIADEWPTFRGRRLTAKEREFGLVITPISPKGVSRPGRLISSNQLWMGRCGRLFFELLYGGYPLETVGNRSTLTAQGVRELNAQALRIHDSIMEIAEQQERERLAAEDAAFRVVIEKRKIELPASGRSKQIAA
jgi:hypothetical protein